MPLHTSRPAHADEPAPLEARRYRDILGRFATGVTVVTTSSPGGEPQPWGTTVNSFTSVSLDPPMVLICVGRERSIHPVIRALGRFAVNILSEENQDLSDCFAGAPSVLPRSAFCEAAYALGESGLPLLDAAIAALECEVQQVIEAGDHTIYIARVLRAAARETEAWPLLYYRRQYLRIEHAETAELRGKPDA